MAVCNTSLRFYNICVVLKISLLLLLPQYEMKGNANDLIFV